MNRLILIPLASFAASVATASLSSIALADEAPAAAPAPSAAAPGAQQDRATDSAPVKSFKSVALEVNPLALGIGRYSAQVEWLPAVHNAIVVNPHVDHVAATIGGADGSSISQSFTGFGAEAGYRYYTGSKGANGFYVGPSLLVAHYSTSGGDQSSTSFSSIGGAVDIGGQWLIGPGVVLGFGAGLQYTKTSLDTSTNGLPLAAAVIAGDGIRPRLLFTVGYSF